MQHISWRMLAAIVLNDVVVAKSDAVWIAPGD